MDKFWYYSQTDFLNQLSDEYRAELLALGAARHYRKNELIFQAGAPGEHVYFLSRGRAKIYELSPTGKELILWYCFPGEMFGLAEVYRCGQREVYARACSDMDVVSVNQGQFKQFLESHPAAAMLTVDILSCRLRILGNMLLNLASDDVMSRLAKLLTRLCASYGKTQGNEVLLDIPLTHQEIADMISASRQTVSSALSKLRRQGILQIENHCIHIKDQNILRQSGYDSITKMLSLQ